MDSPINTPWIPIDRVQGLIQMEAILVTLGCALGAWVVYRILLTAISPERHASLRRLFHNLLIHTLVLIASCALYVALIANPSAGEFIQRIAAYVGVVVLLSGVMVFIKTSRIILFEYLFFSHMKVGVPLLLVNIFTLIMSIFIGVWLLSEIFNVRLAPLLATSAVFSLIVGLAVQDTLGNLFAGIALQLDKPYELGDWIEIDNGSQKWTGKVHDISWRATVLIGRGEELLTVPNRVMSQAQISNFTLRRTPIARSQVFRLPFDCDRAIARTALLKAPTRVARIPKNPGAIVFITETTDSWLSFKLVYFIDDFGAQNSIGDQVIETALEELGLVGIELGTPRLHVTTNSGHDIDLTQPPRLA